MESNRHTLISLTPKRVGALTTLVVCLKGIAACYAPGLTFWLTGPLV